MYSRDRLSTGGYWQTYHEETQKNHNMIIPNKAIEYVAKFKYL